MPSNDGNDGGDPFLFGLHLEDEVSSSSFFVRRQTQKAAGWSSGRLRARCDGRCIQQLPGWPRERLGFALPAVPDLFAHSWTFRRDNLVALSSFISEVLNFLEAAISEHFARSQREQRWYPQLYPLRRQIEASYAAFARLNMVVLHLQRWHK